MTSHSKEKVHFNPILCFTVPITGDLKQDITISNHIECVTCSECLYYYTHPKARELEVKFRGSKIYG